MTSLKLALKSALIYFSLLFLIPCYAQVGPGGLTPRSIQSVTDGTNTCYPYQLKVGTNSCTNGIATISTGSGSGNVGIGTTNYIPEYIGISTLGPSNMVDVAGNVGIGSTNPTYPLDINGNFAVLSHKITLGGDPYGNTLMSFTPNNVDNAAEVVLNDDVNLWVIASNGSNNTSNKGIFSILDVGSFGNPQATSFEIISQNAICAPNGIDITIIGATDNGGCNDEIDTTSSFQIHGNTRSTGAGTFSGAVTGNSIVKSGGTASQYLMANGSVTTIAPITLTGSNVGIGTLFPQALLDVNGTTRFNGNVGIGTWKPQAQLDVEGTLSTAFFNGNVGIGTWIPAGSLDVEGTVNPVVLYGSSVGGGGVLIGTSSPLGGTSVMGTTSTMLGINGSVVVQNKNNTAGGPDLLLLDNNDGGTVPSIPHQDALQIVGEDSGNFPAIYIDAFGNLRGIINFRSSGGTMAAQTATNSGDELGRVAGRGAVASYFGATPATYAGTSAAFSFDAAANFTPASEPAYIAVKTTALGKLSGGTATLPPEVARFQPSGGFSVGGLTWDGTDPGNGNIAVLNSVGIGTTGDGSTALNVIGIPDTTITISSPTDAGSYSSLGTSGCFLNSDQEVQSKIYSYYQVNGVRVYSTSPLTGTFTQTYLGSVTWQFNVVANATGYLIAVNGASADFQYYLDIGNPTAFGGVIITGLTANCGAGGTQYGGWTAGVPTVTPSSPYTPALKLMNVTDTANDANFTFNSNGHLQINNTSSTWPTEINTDIANVSTTYSSTPGQVKINDNATGTSTSSQADSALSVRQTVSGANPKAAIFVDTDWNSSLTTGTPGQLFGVQTNVTATGGEAMGGIFGNAVYENYNTSGFNLTNAFGYTAKLGFTGSGSGTATNYYGYYLYSPVGNGFGTVTNAYGLYLNSLTGSASFTNTPYGIYQAGTSDRNYFGGNIGIGSLSPGQLLDVQGTVRMSKIGTGLAIATGSNAKMGTGSLSSGAATISTTAVKSTSEIFLTDTGGGVGANIGSLEVGTITAGTSFVVNSSNALDSSNFNWVIIDVN